MALGDGDGLDMSPLHGDGVSDETLLKLKVGVVELANHIETVLKPDIEKVDQQVNELASWANAVQGIVTMALGVAETYIKSRPAPVPSTPGKGATFLQGVLGTLTMTPDQRASTIAGLLPGLIG